MKDELYDDAVKFVRQRGQASALILQRNLRIGFGRALTLLDEMEKHKVIGPQDGPRPRQVLPVAAEPEGER